MKILIVNEIVRNGGDVYTSYFPGKFLNVTSAFKVSRTTVINLEQPLHGGNNSDLSQGDLQFLKEQG